MLAASNDTSDENENTMSNMSNPNFTALKTIARREVMRILRIWGQTLVPPAITMTLYFLIFGNLIGSRIGNMGGLNAEPVESHGQPYSLVLTAPPLATAIFVREG